MFLVMPTNHTSTQKNWNLVLKVLQFSHKGVGMGGEGKFKVRSKFDRKEKY
jgi:hypothetical protein